MSVYMFVASKSSHTFCILSVGRTRRGTGVAIWPMCRAMVKGRGRGIMDNVAIDMWVGSRKFASSVRSPIQLHVDIVLR